MRTVARRVPLLDEESVYRLVLRLAARLQTLVADRRRLVRGLCWDLAFWLCSAASLWVFLAAFGYRGRGRRADRGLRAGLCARGHPHRPGRPGWSRQP